MNPAGQPPLVLMAEDDALIGLDLCDALARGGFQVAGPLATNAEALAWIGRSTPALAILDVTLKDGPTDDLARMLRRRGVRFLIHAAASGRAAGRSTALADAPWLPKPAWHRDVIDMMSELAAHPGKAAKAG